MDLSKYFYSFFLIGGIGKIYDDLDELYLVKNERIMETIKTGWTLIIFYFMYTYSKNKYDIFWMLFVWTFLPLVDWVAFTQDPYFLSLVLSITGVGISILFSRNYLSDLKIIYLIPCFLLYCICAPITELFCFELNGPIHDLFKIFGILPNEKTFKLANISTEDLEVSLTKLLTRITSFIFLWIMILGMTFLKFFSFDEEFSNILDSAILLSLTNNGYFLISIINQIYVLYFNEELLKKHKKST